ncbi:unnamed protein product, partial [Trichogramma brassicae]
MYPVLKTPDFSKPFILTTDASDYAIGAILGQGEVGKDHACAYASRCLKSAELRYPTYDKELLAVVYGKEQFYYYLWGRKFTVVTDHQALVHFSKTRKPDLRFNRLKAELRGYEFDIVYRRGLVNSNVDALSRKPVIRQGDDITELPRAQLYELADKQEEETNVLEEEKDHPPGRIFKVRARREKKKKALMTEGRKSGDEKVKSDDGSCSGSDMLRQPHIKMRRTKSPSSCSVCSTSDSDVSMKVVSGPRKAKLRAKEKIANIIQSTRKPKAHAETAASLVYQAQSTQTRSANKASSISKHNKRTNAETQNAHDASDCKATISSDKSAHMSDVMRPSPSYASQPQARLPDTARTNGTSVVSHADSIQFIRRSLPEIARNLSSRLR